MPVPAARGTTLRQLAAQRGINVDWDRLNSSGNDDGNAYRQSIFSQFSDLNPYGSMGATGLDPMGRAGEVDVSMIPDDLSGQWGDMARRLGARDAPELRGMLSRGRGQELYQGDRGMYNEYVADLGNMVYDDQLGFVPGEGGFQEGSRVGRSFDNMGMWGPGAVLGIGLAANAGLFGSLGGAEGAAGGSAGGSAGGNAATGAFDTSGWAGTNINGATGVSPGGFGSGGMLPGAGSGGGSGAGAFDGGGWSGTGINGATGVRGPLDQMMYNFRGFTMNPVGWAMNNPVDAIRGVSSLYNLGSSIAGPRGNQPSQQQGKSAGNAGGNAGAGAPNMAPQFYQNQNTLNQLRQLYGG